MRIIKASRLYGEYNGKLAQYQLQSVSEILPEKSSHTLPDHKPKYTYTYILCVVCNPIQLFLITHGCYLQIKI